MPEAGEADLKMNDIRLFPDRSVNESNEVVDITLFIGEFEAYFDEQIVGEIQKAIDNAMGAAAYILIVANQNIVERLASERPRHRGKA